MSKTLPPSVLSLAQLLEQQSPAPPPCLVEPGLLPMQGILFVGGEPKVGDRLRGVVAAAVDIGQPTVSPAASPVGQRNDLAKGLSTRGND